MYEVYAAAWDSESVLDRCKLFESKSAALEYYNYLKDNPSLMAGSGYDLYLTDLKSDTEIKQLAIPSPL